MSSRISVAVFLMAIAAIFASFAMPGKSLIGPLVTDANFSFSKKWSEQKIAAPNPQKMRDVLKEYGSDIKSAARAHEFNPKAIAAVLWTESRGNRRAVSEKGARGCMQVLPPTERMIGLKGDIFNCQYSIYVGARYLAYIRDAYKFDKMYKVFAAYHDGPERVARYREKDFLGHPYLESIHTAIENMPDPEHW